MTTQTPAPNEDTPRVPSDPDGERNDPAIDPLGQPVTNAPGDAQKAKDNSYSPDFAPQPDPDKVDPGVGKDADIDTDGG